jgi:predicted PurR-regulated permease PerM
MLDKTGLGLLAATGDVILLLIMGVDFALLWGVIAFLFSYIPTIGFWFALIPPTLMALLQFGWQEALIVLIGYVIINTLVDNVISPKIMGSDLNMSTLVVFLSLIVWGWILGGVGAILAVPLTLMVMFILASFHDSRWLAVLMSEDGDFGTEE